VTVLDAFAVVALLKAEPAAGEVQQLVDAGDAMLTPLGVAEVVDHLVRIVGVTEEEAALDVAQLGLADAGPLDAAVALHAGLLRARHYHRRECAVSLADCVAAETARARDDAIATSDPHLLDMCNNENIAVVALPDSRGQRWSQPPSDG
jgi:PIN domain nuclease of toxin-antitoxin system